MVDTCVWVAAVRSRRGASFALLSEISSGRFRFGTSVALFLEYRAQLTQTVEQGVTVLNPREIDAVLAALAFHTVEVPIYYRLRPNLKDANDDKVLECAAHFGADAIVTHNTRDFLNSELNYELDVLRPGEFLRRMRSDT